MAKDSLTLRLSAPGMRATLVALNRLPRDATRELREASVRIAEVLATSAKAASHVDAQAAAVGRTVRTIKDRVPVVQAGGARRVTSTGASASALLFGSELGMSRRSGWYAAPRYSHSLGTQFAERHRGSSGRWFFPSVERELPAVLAEWQAAADAILRKFGAVG